VDNFLIKIFLYKIYHSKKTEKTLQNTINQINTS